MSSPPSPAKVALITGAARRIGACIAARLHAHGYTVGLHAYQSSDALQMRVAELCAQRADSAFALQGDLRDADVPQRLIEQCIAAAGRLDALINNASNFYPTPLGTATAVQWDALFAVNARAPFFLAQAAAPHLRCRRGAIVNLTDAHVQRPAYQYPIYSAAKSALDTLTRSLALELAPDVRVNAIAPGAILWPEQGKSEQAKQAILARTPLGRTGSAEEIAEAVRWLLEEAGFMTGQILPMDGGRALT